MPNCMATVLVAAGGLMGLTAAASAAESAPGPIRVAGSSWVADAPTKVAAALSLFPDAIGQPDIRVNDYDSGQSALASLLAGNAEFALAASTPVAGALLDAAAGRGPDVAVLAAVSLSNQTHVVVADGAAGIATPGDLVGRRVGLMPDTSAHFSWHQFVRHHRLDAHAVRLLSLPVARHADALLAGDVDAVVTWEPWSTLARGRLDDRAQVFGTRLVYTVSWLLVTRTDVLQSHPGAAERVLVGYAAALRVIDRDPKRAMALHAEALGLDPDVLNSQEEHIIWGLRLDWPVVADLESQFQWTGQTAGRPPATAPIPTRYLYARPLRAVHLGRITLPEYFFADGRSGL